MLLKPALFALAVLLPFSSTTASPITKKAIPADFTGLGQIRTFYIGQTHDDLGCLTSAGQWTVDEKLCGVFKAKRPEEQIITLASIGTGNATGVDSQQGAEVSVAECGIDVAKFKCGGGVNGAVFGTWTTKGPIPGHEVLRYSQYGVFATDAEDSPPPLTGPALDIHFYSGIEKGKWVWLGWRSLEEHEQQHKD
ncbi:hypothetical protein VTI74DRAFT_4375 [Chaetomium olivicolor]